LLFADINTVDGQFAFKALDTQQAAQGGRLAGAVRAPQRNRFAGFEW
jgi:hypothetical protein